MRKLQGGGREEREGSGKENNYKTEEARDKMKGSRLALALCFSIPKSTLNLTDHDFTDGVMCLKCLLILSFQMPQAATTTTSKNIGPVQSLLAI